MVRCSSVSEIPMTMYLYSYCCLVISLAGSLQAGSRKCCPLFAELTSDFLYCMDNTSRIIHRRHEESGLSKDNTKRIIQEQYEGKGVEEDNYLTRMLLLYSEFGYKQPCGEHEMVIIHPNDEQYSFTDNGSIIYQEERKQPFIINHDSYCRDNVSSEQIILACPCYQKKCVKTCCSFDETITINKKERRLECRNNVTEDNDDVEGKSFYIYFQNSLLNCTAGRMQSASVKKFQFSKNRNVFMDISEEELDATDYLCGDFQVVNDTHFVQLLCSKDGRDTRNFSKVLMPITCVLHLLTLLVLACVPNIGTTKYKLGMCHTACLLLRAAVTGAFRLAATTYDLACYATVFTALFLFRSASFWSTLLCFDIARTFRHLRVRRHDKHHEHTQMVQYTIIALLCPAILTAITAIMEFVPGLGVSVRPGFTLRGCGYPDARRLWYYEGITSLLLTTTNTMLLAYIVVRLVRLQCDTSLVASSRNTHNTHWCTRRRRCVVYIHLMFLVGPPRLMLAVCLLVYGYTTIMQTLSDCVDTLQAVAMLVFVAARPHVLTKLCSMCTSHGSVVDR